MARVTADLEDSQMAEVFTCTFFSQVSHLFTSLSQLLTSDVGQTMMTRFAIGVSDVRIPL